VRSVCRYGEVMVVRTRKPYALTAMQQAFVDAYLSQPLGERNVHLASLAAGYSKKTAYAQGRKLLQNQLIKKKIMEQSPARAIEMAHIDSAWVLSELANIWETPLGVLFDDDGRLKNIKDMSAQAQKMIASFEVHETEELDDDGNVVVTTRVGKVKMLDRLRSLEDIGKLTKVNAFGTREQAEANASFAELLRAATKTLTASRLEELDITAEVTDG